jgi:hypothetical protein
MTMKKILLFTALIFTAFGISAQKSVDRLFEKYSGKEGFTTIDISGDLLNLAATLEDEDNDDKSEEIKARITGIRILTEKEGYMSEENFIDAMKKDVAFNDYEEFMRVKESDQDLRMLVKTQGRRIKEFLIISGGKENAIIQIKGDMSFSDAMKLSEKAKKHTDFSLSIN